jgi:hypothetical protein
MGLTDIDKLESLFSRDVVAAFLACQTLAIVVLFLALTRAYARERDTLLQVAPIADKAVDILGEVAPLIDELLTVLERTSPSRIRRRRKETGGSHAGEEGKETEPTRTGATGSGD